MTLLNGFISVNLFKQQNLFYTNEVDKLLVDNQKLHTELEQFYKYGVEVNVTMYQPVYPQTDNTPDITADGTRIRINKASDYKFVALSRNLLNCSFSINPQRSWKNSLLSSFFSPSFNELLYSVN